MLNRFHASVLLTFLLGCGVTLGLHYAPQLLVETQAEENEKDEKPGADEWFVEQRAYPLKAIPFDARVRAIEQMDAAETRQTQARVRLYGKAAAAIAQQSQPRWEALGPQPIANGNTGAALRPALPALRPASCPHALAFGPPLRLTGEDYEGLAKRVESAVRAL